MPSQDPVSARQVPEEIGVDDPGPGEGADQNEDRRDGERGKEAPRRRAGPGRRCAVRRSEEHTSELQSHSDLVCRLLLEKKETLRVSTPTEVRQRVLVRPAAVPEAG